MHFHRQVPRLLEEEQGVNNLFLAVGFLEWFDPNTPDKSRYAPLLLIPVELERYGMVCRI